MMTYSIIYFYMTMFIEGKATKYCEPNDGWFSFLPGIEDGSLWGPERPEGIPDIKNIMIINDHEDSLWITAMRVSHLGMDAIGVRGTNAAIHAIELAKRFSQDDPPDLVIVDYNMPRMDGLNVVRDLRIIWPGCRVVCLTATALADQDGGGIENNSLHQQAKELGVPIGSLPKFMLNSKEMLQGLITESVQMVSALPGPTNAVQEVTEK